MPRIGLGATLSDVVAGTGGRAEQVAAQLETAISVGLVRAGVRLPSERDLSEQLGVTVLQLRQALALLRDRGAITTRRGRGGGSFVADASAASGAQVAARLRDLSTDQLRDLGDLSTTITGGAAQLAAERADASEVARLRLLAETLATARTAEELRLADSRFHIALAAAAQSRRLTATTVQVRGELSPLLWFPIDGQLPTQAALDHHSALVDAIGRGDADEAVRCGRRHGQQETQHIIQAHLAQVLAQVLAPVV